MRLAHTLSTENIVKVAAAQILITTIGVVLYQR